ncbi:MAG TPA: porin [Pseudomonas sp.]|nr:porin [Pseudomonas sp.]
MTFRLSSCCVAALCSLGFVSASHAQSSVLMYGVLDASISGYSTHSRLSVPAALATGVAPAHLIAAPTGLKRSATRLANSALTASRLGFRGQEDLGGGMAASFWLEAGLSNDDGVKGLDNFNRRATLSLSGPWGELRLGRDFAASFWNDTVFDPFGTNGVGANLVTSVNSAVAINHGALPRGFAGDNYYRVSNSIGYLLPKNAWGVYGHLQYGFHEHEQRDGLAVNGNRKGRYAGARLGYARGPLDVAASVGEDYRDEAGTGFVRDRLHVVNVGASYDFGAVKLYGELSRLTDRHSDPTKLAAFGGASSARYTGGLIGMTAPVGAGLIRAAYSQVNYAAPAPLMAWDASANDAQARKLALGYVHNLSKRTALYATVARVNLKWNGATHGPMAAVAGGGLGYSTAFGDLGNVYKPKSATGYDIGVRHSF